MYRERIVIAGGALGIEREVSRFLWSERELKPGDFGLPAGGVDAYPGRAAELSGAISVDQADPKPSPHAFHSAFHYGKVVTAILIGGGLGADRHCAGR
jgi:hypothetical protein